MLNIQKYQNVAIGDTVQECEKKYLKMIKGSGAAVAGEDTKKSPERSEEWLRA